MTARGRIVYLEWLRVLACAAVVLLHVFAGVLDNASIAEIGVARVITWTSIQIALTRWAVPVFFMITGALLLDPDRKMSTGKIGRYVLRALAVIAVFGTVFALMEIVFMERAIEPSMFPQALLAAFQERSWAHMWYLYDLLGVYLLLPVLRAFCASASKGELRGLVSVLFVFTGFVPLANSAFDLEIPNIVWLSASVLYVLLGYYLRFHVEFSVPVALAGLGSLVVLEATSLFSVLCLDELNGWLYGPSSAFIAIYSASVFLFAKKFCRISSGGGWHLVESLSQLSFGVYLVHPVFLNVLYKVVGWGYLVALPVVGEAMTFVFVFLGSCLLSLVMKKLSLLRTIL